MQGRHNSNMDPQTKQNTIPIPGADLGTQEGEDPGKLWGFEELQIFERQFSTNHTIFIRPEKLDFES